MEGWYQKNPFTFKLLLTITFIFSFVARNASFLIGLSNKNQILIDTVELATHFNSIDNNSAVFVSCNWHNFTQHLPSLVTEHMNIQQTLLRSQ